MRKYIRTLLVAAVMLSLAAAPLSASAHGGEDHGDESKTSPAPTAAMAPRAIAQTEEFELVATLDGKQLTFTLDRFATNEPVADAQIEVDSGGRKAVATQTSPGVYSIPGDSFVAPGKYPLSIAVEAGESTDLLMTTLDLAPPAAGIERAHATSEWAIWSVAVALLLAAGGLVAMRRRHKNRKHR